MIKNILLVAMAVMSCGGVHAQTDVQAEQLQIYKCMFAIDRVKISNKSLNWEKAYKYYDSLVLPRVNNRAGLIREAVDVIQAATDQYVTDFSKWCFA